MATNECPVKNKEVRDGRIRELLELRLGGLMRLMGKPGKASQA